MSIWAYEYVWALRGLSQPHRALMLALAEHVHGDTAVAWPGQQRLAEMLERGESTVRKDLADLVERGILEREHRQSKGKGKGRGRAPDMYRFPLAEGVPTARQLADEEDTSTAQQLADEALPTAQQVADGESSTAKNRASTAKNRTFNRSTASAQGTGKEPERESRDDSVHNDDRNGDEDAEELSDGDLSRRHTSDHYAESIVRNQGGSKQPPKWRAA